MKNPDNFIKEYVSNLNEEDIKFLYSRLSERFLGDTSEAINFLDKNNDFSKWFYSAKSSNDLYDMIDKVFKFVEKEHNKRYQLIKN
jgi:hypothetical protein